MIKETQTKIREWLKQALLKKGYGSRKALAEFIHTNQNAITQMLNPAKNRGFRVITSDELIKMAEFFGELPPGLAKEEQADKDKQFIIREWLGRKIEECGRRTKGKLSRHLKISQNAVTNILKSPSMRGYRAIKAHELVKMAEFFGEMPPCLTQEEIQAERSEFISLYEQISPEQQQIILSLLKSLIPAKRKNH